MSGTAMGPLGINGISWDVYERGLDKVTKTTVDQTPNFVPELYSTQHKKTKRISERQYAGIPEAEPWNPNGEPIPVSAISSRYKIEAENGWIGNSVAYTLEMKTFDQYDLKRQLAGDLASSVAVKKQKVAVGFLCAGFTNNWNAEAAEPLFSATHKLDPRYAGGNGTASNLVVGAPSVATLAEAINLLISTPDDLGNPGSYLPRFVLCHTNKYLEWKQILGNQDYRSDTDKHTPNPFAEYRIIPKACPWITSEDMWFLYGHKHGLVWNEVISFKSQLSTDPKTQTTTHMAYSCFTRYARDWRGLVASQG